MPIRSYISALWRAAAGQVLRFFYRDWGVTPTRMHSVVITVHCLLVQCVCQQCTGTSADHVRTGLRKGNTCLNMGISRGLKVAQLLAGFPDGITLYVDRPFVPQEYQCFSWLGTAPSVYLCNLRACWLLHQDESVPLNEGGMEMENLYRSQECPCHAF